MLFTIFYILGAIETFLLSAYLAVLGSDAQNSLLLNLSLSRLAAVAFFPGGWTWVVCSCY